MQDMTRPNSNSPLPYIQVNFTTPVTAFGANLFSNSPRGTSFAVTVLGTQYTVDDQYIRTSDVLGSHLRHANFVGGFHTRRNEPDRRDVGLS